MKKVNKMCSFYVNDWHFTMMMLPYIKEKMENNEKVTIITEESLETNIKTLLEKINIEDKFKKEIEQIGWKKTSINNIDEKINSI